MKKPMILLVLLVAGALPAIAQSNRQFGFLVGASKRSLDSSATPESSTAYLDDEFNLSNNSVEFFFAMDLDDSTRFRIKAGRLESPVRFTTKETLDANGNVTESFARDVEGEVQHIDALIEYRYSEAYGSTGIFGGVGLYRQSGEGFETEANYGWQVGVNADFPLSRRYGVVLEGAYHSTKADYRPKYMTLSAGMRFSF
jgi:hypothetical protein